MNSTAFKTVTIENDPNATHPINLKNSHTGEWRTVGYEIPGKAAVIPAKLELDSEKIAAAQASHTYIMQLFGK